MEKREYNWLDRVDSPRDLKRLSLDELRLYCDELRHYIIEQCAVNPGHLASSLGAVELAAAIHYVFDTPDDRLLLKKIYGIAKAHGLYVTWYGKGSISCEPDRFLVSGRGYDRLAFIQC